MPAILQGEPPAAPAFTPGRYDEDYTYLDGASSRSGDWWERLKRIPLDDAGSVRLTLGGELRARYELYENDGWSGDADADHDYWWLRALPCADLQLGRWFRLFSELISAFELDDEAGVSPVDEDRIDILQAFADIAAPLGEAAGTLTLRGGRQVLSYGSERLIGSRYGPNVLQAFDSAKLAWASGSWRADALYARPVDAEPGELDDSTSRTEDVWTVYATRELAAGMGLDAYYIGYRNDEAAFNQGTGEEVRHTFGTRWFGNRSSWDWNFELFGQLGRFDGGDILAWSAASDSGYTFADVPLRPRLGLRANIISGDRDPDDPDLETFQPLFPKGKYFGEIGLLGPYNLINAHPFVQLALVDGLELELATVLYWRESLDDGIYSNGGELLRPDGGSHERFIGTQIDVTLSYAVDRAIDATVGYSAFLAGPFIEDTGSSSTVHFVALELRFRF